MKKMMTALLCLLLALSLMACAAPAAAPAEEPAEAPAAAPAEEPAAAPADEPVEMTVAEPTAIPVSITIPLEELTMGSATLDLLGLGKTCDVNIEYFQNGDEANDAIAVSVNDGGDKDLSYSIYPGYFNETCHMFLCPKADGKTVIVIGYGLDAEFADTRTDFILYDGTQLLVSTAIGLPAAYADGTFTMAEGDEFTLEDLQFTAPAANG